jgi:AbrB family looped-hinge helix DNA binding protein
MPGCLVTGVRASVACPPVPRQRGSGMIAPCYGALHSMKELLTVTRQGQITLPAEIRQTLGLKHGDKVAWSLSRSKDGQATLRPIRSVAELTLGAVKPRRRPENLKHLRRRFEGGG